MRYFISFLTLILIGCSVDELPPCEGAGIPGEVCKEYQYVFGEFNGVNEYSYDLEAGVLEKVTTLNKKSQEEGSKYFTYDSIGRVVKIERFKPSGALLSNETFEYSENGELVKEVFDGASLIVKEYLFNDTVQIAEKVTTDGVVEWIDSLEYYTGTRNLYRRLRYVSGELSQISLIVEYTNGVTEETITNQNGILQEKIVQSFIGELLSEKLIYNSSGGLVQRDVWEYDDEKLSKISRYDEDEEVFESLEYYRY